MDRKLLLQLGTAANKVVTGKAGLFEGCRFVKGSLAKLNYPAELPHLALDTFLNSVPAGLATGDSLLYVDDDKFLAAIEQMMRFEALHRVPVTLECRSIYFGCRKLLDGVGDNTQR
jgi:hypothetical protein